MALQRPFQQKRINGRVRSITEMAGHSSALGARDTADRMQRAGIAPAASGIRTRDDNIAAARADGTFDAKRKAFNNANQGSFMDEAGRIGPRAPGTGGATGSPAATSFVSAPGGQGGSKQVKVPSPGSMVSAASSPKPAIKATTSPAMPTGIGMVDAVTKQVSTRPDKPVASQGSGFTSMPPGSRDLYAEEKAREAQAKPVSMAAAASAPDSVMKQAQALGNAAKIAKSPETAATMAKAKASLPAKPISMAAAAAPPKPMTPPAPSGASKPKPTPQEMGKKLIATATPDQWDQAANKPENDLKQAEADAIAGRMARMGAVEKGARAVASAGDTVLNTAGDAVKGVGAMVSAVRTGFPKVVSDIQTSVRKSVMGDSNESPAEKRFREMQEANNKAPAKKESAPVTSPIISRAPSTPPLQPKKKVVASN